MRTLNWLADGESKMIELNEVIYVDKFDVIVVGAGTAGSIAAVKLASLGHKVLVIEKKSFMGGIYSSTMRRIEKMLPVKEESRLRRPFSLCLTLVFVVGVLLLVIFVVMPQLFETILSLQNSIPTFLASVKEEAERLFAQNPEIADYINSIQIDWKAFLEGVVGFLSTGAGSVLSSTVSAAMTSKKTAELDAPAPVYEEDQTLQLGEEKIVKAETKGSRWVTNLVTKKNGVVVSDELLHNSTYRGKPATIKRNQSGVVIPATDPAGSAAESSPAESPGSGETTAPNGNEPDGNSGGPQGPGTTETQPSQTQGPSSTTEAADGDGGQNVIPPNPFN